MRVIILLIIMVITFLSACAVDSDDLPGGGNTGDELEIISIVFGTGIDEQNGEIGNPGNSFSPQPAIYYSLMANQRVPQRMKIKKVWRLASTPLFEAIQIVEAQDLKIWGSIRKVNDNFLGLGEYELEIYGYNPDDNTYYEIPFAEQVNNTFEIR